MEKGVFGSFVQHLERERLTVDYFYIVATALFLYDYLLTLHIEIQTIWLGSNWSYTKILFLLTRYLPVAQLYLALREQIFLDVPVESCKSAYSAVTWLIVMGIAFAEAILAVRTYAVWHQERVVGIILAALQIAVFVVNSFSASRFLDSLKIAPPPFRGFRGCFVVSVNKILYLNYLALTVSQTIVLGLMCIRSYRAYRGGGPVNELSQVIHRDGLLFYFYLVLMVYLNLFIVFFSPVEFQVLLAPLQSVIHSVFTARIILNIRSLARRDSRAVSLTELQETQIAPLVFRCMDMDRTGACTLTECGKCGSHNHAEA